MDLLRAYEAEYRLQHRHADGSWVELEPKPDNHDSATTDPERQWPNGQVFRCPACSEQITVVRSEDRTASGQH
jgi:hypothetical protein